MILVQERIPFICRLKQKIWTKLVRKLSSIAPWIEYSKNITELYILQSTQLCRSVPHVIRKTKQRRSNLSCVYDTPTCSGPQCTRRIFVDIFFPLMWRTRTRTKIGLRFNITIMMSYYMTISHRLIDDALMNVSGFIKPNGKSRIWNFQIQRFMLKNT